MDIFMAKLGGSDTIDSVHRNAERKVQNADYVSVVGDGTIAVDLDTKQRLVNDAEKEKTTFNIRIEEDGDYVLFTQHMNWEFASTFLENVDQTVSQSEQYVFATDARDYVLEDTLSGAEQVPPPPPSPLQTACRAPSWSIVSMRTHARTHTHARARTHTMHHQLTRAHPTVHH